jgi:uncharacterized membrane protein YdjX (TVP38/TMEM64 family)
MSRKVLTRLAIAVILAAGIALAVVYREQLSTEGLEVFISGLGLWGPVVFIALWVVLPPLFVPGLALSLAGGALFGPVWGTVYTVLGATGGATVAFLLARVLAADWVESMATGYMAKVKAGVENEGWIYVAFTRLVPLFPFNVLNYAFGLTRISLRTYVLTSMICMAPGTAGYTYLGFAGREALVGGEDLVKKGVIALAVFAALVFLPILMRKWYVASRAANQQPGKDSTAGAPGC